MTAQKAGLVLTWMIWKDLQSEMYEVEGWKSLQKPGGDRNYDFLKPDVWEAVRWGTS